MPLPGYSLSFLVSVFLHDDIFSTGYRLGGLAPPQSLIASIMSHAGHDTCTMITVHTCIMIIVHACTMTILHACTMIMVHACTMIIVFSSVNSIHFQAFEFSAPKIVHISKSTSKALGFQSRKLYTPPGPCVFSPANIIHFQGLWVFSFERNTHFQCKMDTEHVS